MGIHNGSIGRIDSWGKCSKLHVSIADDSEWIDQRDGEQCERANLRKGSFSGASAWTNFVDTFFCLKYRSEDVYSPWWQTNRAMLVGMSNSRSSSDRFLTRLSPAGTTIALTSIQRSSTSTLFHWSSWTSSMLRRWPMRSFNAWLLQRLTWTNVCRYASMGMQRRYSSSRTWHPSPLSAVFLCFHSRAAVMSGKHVGVQAILREKHMPSAIYVHCYAHRLNLVICDVSKAVPYLSEFYSILSKLHSYFSSSVTREFLSNAQGELNTGKIISFWFGSSCGDRSFTQNTVELRRWRNELTRGGTADGL